MDGKVFTCGSGRDARLGLGVEHDVALPQLVTFPERIICVAAGLSHSVACSARKVIFYYSLSFFAKIIKKFLGYRFIPLVTMQSHN